MGSASLANIGDDDYDERAKAHSRAWAEVVSAVFASSVEGDQCRLDVRGNRRAQTWRTSVFGHEAFTG